MAEDKTVRLILGVLLVIASMPLLIMGTMVGGFGGYTMMGFYAGSFWPGAILCYMFGLGLLGLGLYLISDSLKK